MKQGILIFIMSLLVVQTGCELQQDTAAILAESDKLEAEFIKMAQMKHWGMLADYYHKSDDVVLYPSTKMEIRGWEGINEELLEMGKMTAAEAEIEYTLDREGSAVSGDYVVTWGKGTWTETYPDRESTTFNWRYTDVKQKIDGKWYYIHDHGSVPMEWEDDDDDDKDHENHSGDM